MPPLKASSGRGIYKGEGATSQFKPLPLIEKEKRESLATATEILHLLCRLRMTKWLTF
ncbi:hypothetical protein [Helicobacter marmotae]|uniref:hypothetical protein n=1 Tax=Helicobacter marmotae TaxID=152490 RepID=UPI0014752161|nr:hypothetical protein [Helicobacter marmotae]